MMDALLLVVGIVVYVLPGCIASIREHQNKFAIWGLNIVLGWTFLGWVAAFVWSLTKVSGTVHINTVFNDEKKCPYCAETIKKEAIVCRFCGKDIN